MSLGLLVSCVYYDDQRGLDHVYNVWQRVVVEPHLEAAVQLQEEELSLPQLKVSDCDGGLASLRVLVVLNWIFQHVHLNLADGSARRSTCQDP